MSGARIIVGAPVRRFDLPSFLDCEATPNSDRTALQRFIYDTEPSASGNADQEWRRDLAAVLTEVTGAEWTP